MTRTLSHLILASSTALMFAATGAALAAGTAAGTGIINEINVSHVVGGNTITLPSAATSEIVVDQAIDFSLLLGSPATIPVEAGDLEVDMIFTLTNTGNAPARFDIDVDQIVDTNGINLTYDPTGSGNPGTWSFFFADASPTTPTPALYEPAGINGIGPIAPDASYFVAVIANIPDAPDGANDAFTVTARPTNASGTALLSELRGSGLTGLDIVFADPLEDGVETETSAYQVQAPQLSASKTAQVVSENLDGTFSCSSGAAEAGASSFIPGACVEYTITVSNDPLATNSANDLTFTDVLPTGTTLIGVINNSGFDSVTIGANAIEGTVLQLMPGTSATLTFRVTID